MKFKSPIQLCIGHGKVAGTLQSPERHSIALGEPQAAHSEGGVLLRCLIHLYLPKSGFQIQAGKVAGDLLSTLAHLVFEVMGRNPSLYGHVKALEVDAKM